MRVPLASLGMGVGMTLASVVPSATVQAANLAEARLRPAAATFVTPKAIYDVERCILGVDTPDVPITYRAPDRPNESMIYYSASMSRPMIVELRSNGRETTITIRNPAAKGFERKFQVCV